jgi:hypothetical protein
MAINTAVYDLDGLKEMRSLFLHVRRLLILTLLTKQL